MGAGRQWSNVFQILKENDFRPRILLPAKLSMSCEGRAKAFSDVQGLKKIFKNKLKKECVFPAALPGKFWSIHSTKTTE